jgi:catechol 2,3-dioxygenase-like lactoylglutathione lyase family enzyme
MKRIAAPRIFRVLIAAKNLAESKRFYEAILGGRGRYVAGGRVYFDCGPVILGLLDYSTVAEAERPHPTEAIYFATNDLEEVHRRARKLGCLDAGLIHNDSANRAGEVVVRPWGELSFYAQDPAGNPICFVEARTKFTGTARQVAKLRGAGSRTPAVRPPSKKGRRSTSRRASGQPTTR